MTPTVLRSRFLLTTALLAAAALGCADSRCPGDATERNGVCVKNKDNAVLGDGGADADGGGIRSGDAGDAMSSGNHARKDAGDGAFDGGPAGGGKDADTHPVDGDAMASEPDAGEGDASPAADGGETSDAGTPIDAALDHDASEPGPCEAAGCHPLATCTAAGGVATCKCPIAYDGNGKYCARDFCLQLDGSPTCGPHTTCTPGTGEDVACACAPSYEDCIATEESPGCETHLQTSAASCGSCGYACAGKLACVDGKCEQKAWNLFAGFENVCALSPDIDHERTPHQVATCWGRNTVGSADYRTLGDPALDDPYVDEPHEIPTLRIRGRDISISTTHGCSVDDEYQTVTCWGANGNAQLGVPATDDLEPGERVVRNISGITKVATGLGHTCVVAKGVVKCWGDNRYHQLGTATSSNQTSTITTIVGLPTTMIDVHAAGVMTCALSSSGHVWCWSNNAEGKPTQVTLDTRGTLLDDAVELVMASDPEDTIFAFLACARRSSGEVACWGYHHYYDVPGIGAGQGDPFVATELTSLPPQVTQLAVGSGHLCMRANGNHVYCMGARPGRGALGLPVTGTPYSQPTLVPNVEDVIEIVAGGCHTCIRRGSGQVQCWGRNESGELGNGGTLTSYLPVNVTGLP